MFVLLVFVWLSIGQFVCGGVHLSICFLFVFPLFVQICQDTMSWTCLESVTEQLQTKPLFYSINEKKVFLAILLCNSTFTSPLTASTFFPLTSKWRWSKNAPYDAFSFQWICTDVSSREGRLNQGVTGQHPRSDSCEHTQTRSKQYTYPLCLWTYTLPSNGGFWYVSTCLLFCRYCRCIQAHTCPYRVRIINEHVQFHGKRGNDRMFKYFSSCVLCCQPIHSQGQARRQLGICGPNTWAKCPAWNTHIHERLIAQGSDKTENRETIYHTSGGRKRWMKWKTEQGQKQY